MTAEEKINHVTEVLVGRVEIEYQPETKYFYESFRIHQSGGRMYGAFQARLYGSVEAAYEAALEHALSLGGVLTVPPGYDKSPHFIRVRTC